MRWLNSSGQRIIKNGGRLNSEECCCNGLVCDEITFVDGTCSIKLINIPEEITVTITGIGDFLCDDCDDQDGTYVLPFVGADSCDLEWNYVGEEFCLDGDAHVLSLNVTLQFNSGPSGTVTALLVVQGAITRVSTSGSDYVYKTADYEISPGPGTTDCTPLEEYDCAAIINACDAAGYTNLGSDPTNSTWCSMSNAAVDYSVSA